MCASSQWALHHRMRAGDLWGINYRSKYDPSWVTHWYWWRDNYRDQSSEEMPRKHPRRLGSLPRHPPPVLPSSYCSSCLHFMPTQPSAYRQVAQTNSNSVFQITQFPSMKHTAIYSTLMACSPTISSVGKSLTKCPALTSHTSLNVKFPSTPPNTPTESFPILSYPSRGHAMSARLNKTYFDARK